MAPFPGGLVQNLFGRSGSAYSFLSSFWGIYWRYSFKACNTLATHLIDVPEPLADVLKALGVADVVDEHDAHGSSVVGGGDGVEPLLTCRVPKHTYTHNYTTNHAITDWTILELAITRIFTLFFLGHNATVILICN